MTDNTWTDDYGQLLVGVHDARECEGHRCTIHNRSNHHMLDWPQHWRTDKAFMEVMCAHNTGHPDPDEAYGSYIHACDGCCIPRTDWSVKLRVWKCVSTDGDLNNEFRHTSVEKRAESRLEAMDLWMRFNDYLLHLKSTYDTMNFAAGDDPTEFAKLAASHPDRHILLRMNMNGDIDELVWAQLRPVE